MADPSPSPPFGPLRRFGVFGGSFNPVHLGHCSIAAQIRAGLGLERVIFLPAATPPHKQQDPEMASGEDRLEMCRLALADQEGLAASDYELRRGGVSYTIETARALRAAYGPGCRIWFLIGSDSLAELHTWREAGELLRLVSFAIACRPDRPPSEAVWALLGQRLGAEAVEALRAGSVPIQPVEISSTDIRRRIRSGAVWDGLVHPAVASYLRRKGLYRSSSPKDRS